MVGKLLLATVVFVASCMRYTPPAQPVARPAVEVQAPFERTWDAAIDAFAEQVITVETLERASGFIVASRGSISARTKADTVAGRAMADCGGMGVLVFLPTSAKYNVVVRPAGSQSTVRVTASFMGSRSYQFENTLECSSKGSFEAALESSIKARAEKR